MSIEKKIQSILESDVSTKRLYEYTGVDYATLSRLRNGKRRIDGLQLATAKRLLKGLDLVNNSSINDNATV